MALNRTQNRTSASAYDVSSRTNGMESAIVETDTKTIQSTPDNDHMKYMKVNRKNFNKFSYFIAGIDVTQQNLDQMTPYIPGISRIFMHRTPLFMEVAFEDMTSNFKSLVETGAKSIGGVGDIGVEFTPIEGGFNNQSFQNISKTSDDSNQLSFTLYEQTGSPVREFLETWVTGVRDPRSGIAHYHGAVETPDHPADGSKYIPYGEKNHTAEFIYYSLDPTAHFLEYACMWAHCMPTTVPKDHYNYNSGDRDAPALNLTFNGTKYESRFINDIAINYIIKDQLEYNYLNFDPDFEGAGFSTPDYRLNLPAATSTAN